MQGVSLSNHKGITRTKIFAISRQHYEIYTSLVLVIGQQEANACDL